MSLYIETIKLENGLLRNLPFHQDRFERTRRKELQLRRHPLLEQIIELPEGLNAGVYKCRVLYGRRIKRIDIEPYDPPKTSSLKLVHSNAISYSFKFRDRRDLEALFLSRGESDDIIIVKKGNITDSYYANIVLWDGTKWVTPDTPLLSGTMRASLLDQGLLEERHITTEDLGSYSRIRLINAMNHLDHAPEILPEHITP